jgi:hypothetical protein
MPGMASNDQDAERLQAEFAAVQNRWVDAVDAHRMAPPDHGFSARLAALAAAARAEAEVCRKAHAAGYGWPPSKSAGDQPYELRPGTGRRGPQALWQRFDAAVVQLTGAAATSDLLLVADANDTLADACEALSDGVEQEDRASGLLAPDQARHAS